MPKAGNVNPPGVS